MISRALQWAFLGAALLMVFGVYFVSKNAAVLQQEIYAKLEDKFGFTTETIEVRTGGQSIESFSVSPEANSLLFQAGFRKGDIILSHTKQEFFSLLYKNKGSTETIDIIRGNAASLVEDEQRMTISFQIPG